ncbi:hypothetical protein DFH09DRAFT_1195632 [Mycena vulgaris]|nr:hypothetical protein DFH09DRAFT_1195632 [Mycena vulgaris]
MRAPSAPRCTAQSTALVFSAAAGTAEEGVEVEGYDLCAFLGCASGYARRPVRKLVADALRNVSRFFFCGMYRGRARWSGSGGRRRIVYARQGFACARSAREEEEDELRAHGWARTGVEQRRGRRCGDPLACGRDSQYRRWPSTLAVPAAGFAACVSSVFDPGSLPWRRWRPTWGPAGASGARSKLNLTAGASAVRRDPSPSSLRRRLVLDCLENPDICDSRHPTS